MSLKHFLVVLPIISDISVCEVVAMIWHSAMIWNVLILSIKEDIPFIPVDPGVKCVKAKQLYCKMNHMYYQRVLLNIW